MLVNGIGAGLVAAAAAKAGALIVQISTNEVFDGASDRPYRERDRPEPVNAYGASKLRAEQLVASATADHLIIRTAWLFGPDGDSFVTRIRSAAAAASARREPLRVVTDESGNPTWTPALATLVSRAASDSYRGILHVAGEPPASRHDWAVAILRDSDVEVLPTESRSFVRASRVPRHAILDMGLARSLGLPAIDWAPHIVDTPGNEG